MKKLISIFVFSVSTMTFAADLEVDVKNYSQFKGQGQIVAQVFNSAETFPGKKPLKETINHLKDFKVFNFENLPPGEYAVIVYIDSNSNNKLDRNWIGIPKETVVVSNNAKGSMGPPKFKDAKFSLAKEERKSLRMELKNKD